MKAIAVLLSVLMLSMAPVHAQEASLPDPGVKPGSVLYGLDKALERIELALARGNAKKAEVHLKHASERLAEANALTDEGDTENVEDTLADYEEEMNETLEELEKAKGIGQNVSALVKEVNESIEKHVQVLKLVLEKVPEQAKASIQKNIDKAIENNERHKAKIAAKDERKQGFEIGNISKGKPDDVGKKNETGAPENAGKPDDAGKNKTSGIPDDAGKPDGVGKPEDKGKPE